MHNYLGHYMSTQKVIYQFSSIEDDCKRISKYWALFCMLCMFNMAIWNRYLWAYTAVGTFVLLYEHISSLTW